MDKVLEMTIEEFKEAMKAAGTRRVYLVWDDEGRRVLASHTFLEPWAEELARDRVDYQRHEGIFLEIGKQSACLLGAFVHNTTRGQAAGGVRYWRYDRFADYLNDGIRLAKGMTHKNALAGLWWGGGKGVVARPENWRDPEVRRVVFREYGDFISSLQGCYVTAEDVGADTSDMYQVLTGTRFTTCIPVETGGSGNPSVPTARGVVTGMEAALDYRGMGALKDKTVAVMGTGHVGVPLIRFLLEKGVRKIVGADVDPENVRLVKEEFSPERVEVRLVEPGDFSILAEDVDIVAPCAVGGILNSDTIPHIRARIVCGAANNQLRDPATDGPALKEREISYVPDFLVNRMGIVNCANEQYGYLPEDPAILRHYDREWENGIWALTQRVLRNSDATGEATDVEAVRLAEEFAAVPHPIWGHRGKQIIAGLVEAHWERG